MPDEHDAARAATPEVRRPEMTQHQAEQTAEPEGALPPLGRYLWYLVPFLAVWAAAAAGLVLYFI